MTSDQPPLASVRCETLRHVRGSSPDQRRDPHWSERKCRATQTPPGVRRRKSWLRLRDRGSCGDPRSAPVLSCVAGSAARQIQKRGAADRRPRKKQEAGQTPPARGGKSYAGGRGRVWHSSRTQRGKGPPPQKVSEPHA